jgi:hypothetical protein
MADQKKIEMDINDKIEQLHLIIETVNNDWNRETKAFDEATKAGKDDEAYEHYKSFMALGSERSYIYEQLWKLMDQLKPVPAESKGQPKGGRQFSRKSNGRPRKTAKSARVKRRRS